MNRQLLLIFILLIIKCSSYSQQPAQKVYMGSLQTWDRKFFKKPLDDPFLFYCIFGNFSADFRVSTEKYRTEGLPPGCSLMKYGPTNHPDYIKSLLQGFLWESLKTHDSSFASKINSAKECFIIRGEFKDTSNLNYLRDVVGIITYLMDKGGVGVYDPQGFKFLHKQEWLENIFNPDGAVPRNHITILYSEENGKKWYHTRGLRKFGRPDLSIHEVPSQHEDAVYDLFNRFIEYVAFGGIIADKQEIKMNNLPAGMWCETKGDAEDPDFNNKHVEIHWN